MSEVRCHHGYLPKRCTVPDCENFICADLYREARTAGDTIANPPTPASNERLSDERLELFCQFFEQKLPSEHPLYRENYSKADNDIATLLRELQDRRVEVEKYKAWAASCDLTPTETTALPCCGGYVENGVDWHNPNCTTQKASAEQGVCPTCKARWEMHHDQYCDYEPADRTGHFGGGLSMKTSGERE